MKITTMEKRTSQGLPYMVREERCTSKNKIYISDIVPDIEAIFYEDNIKVGRGLVIDNDILAVWRKYYENPDAGRPSKEALEDIGQATLEDCDAILLPINSQMLEEEKWMDFILKRIGILDNRIVFLCVEENIRGNVGYKRFLLKYPDITVKRMKIYYAQYFEECWQKRFGVSPDFSVKMVLSRLQSCEKLYAGLIQNFITYIALHTTEDKVPGVEEINEFFAVKGNIPWKDRINELVSMEESKRRICELIQQQIYMNKLKEEDMCDEYMAVRAVICGNAGVGKSTLLEIVEMAFREEGLIKKGSRYVSCRSLISDHVGGSEKKLEEIVKEADLLIFDELGGLTIKDSFSAGLVQQIVYLAESRKDIHMFFIGYDSDVNEFLKLNQGIRSRIQHFIDIPDYTKEELSEIGMNMLKKYHYRFDQEEIRKTLNDFIEKLVRFPDYGNARAIRVLMDHLNIIKAAEYDKDRSLNMNITAEELEQAANRYFASQPVQKVKEVMGFVKNA